jgi:hypothetical protein
VLIAARKPALFLISLCVAMAGAGTNRFRFRLKRP